MSTIPALKRRAASTDFASERLPVPVYPPLSQPTSAPPSRRRTATTIAKPTNPPRRGVLGGAPSGGGGGGGSGGDHPAMPMREAVTDGGSVPHCARANSSSCSDIPNSIRLEG